MTINPTIDHTPDAQDLFNTGVRPYFRLSELASCDLRIAHNIIGTPSKPSGTSVFFPNHKRDLAFWMGDALEPVINRFLHYHAGLSLAFHNDRQLEPQGNVPKRMGHPDGLVYLAAPGDLTDWAKYNLPAEAVRRLLDGEVLLLEDKTMRDEDFRLFTRAGGDFRASHWISKYPTQIASYLQILGNPEYDYLWPDSRQGPRDDRDNQSLIGSRDYNAFLEDIGRTRPTSALAAVFNTATKEIAFNFTDFADERQALEDRLDELVTIQQIMENGELPPPSFDGRAPDCFFCPFTHVCPAIQTVKAELNDLQILPDPNELHQRHDLAEWEELATEYNDLKSQADAINERLSSMRSQMKGKLGLGDNFYTDSFQIILSDVSGRQTIDAKQLTDNLSTIATTLNGLIPYMQIDDETGVCMACWASPDQDGEWADHHKDIVIPDAEDVNNDIHTYHWATCPYWAAYEAITLCEIPMKRGAGHERLWIRPLYGPTAGKDNE